MPEVCQASLAISPAKGGGKKTNWPVSPAPSLGWRRGGRIILLLPLPFDILGVPAAFLLLKLAGEGSHDIIKFLIGNAKSPSSHLVGDHPRQIFRSVRQGVSERFA